MSGTAQNENGNRFHPSLTGKFCVSCWRTVLSHGAVIGNVSSHTEVLAYQLAGGAIITGGWSKKRKRKQKEWGEKKRRKSLPSQEFKSQNCWQTLTKLLASFLVRNPTQAGMTSKHNLNGNVLKIQASPCLSYPAVTQTQLYALPHWSFLKIITYVSEATRQDMVRLMSHKGLKNFNIISEKFFNYMQ